MNSEFTWTRRTAALITVACLAALPLVWFSVDVNAGETLLKLTAGASYTPSAVIPR